MKNDDVSKPEYLGVFHTVGYQSVEDLFVDTGEKTFDIHLEIVAFGGWWGVFGEFSTEALQPQHGAVSAFGFSTGVRVVDEAWFKDRLEIVIEQVVDDSIGKVGGENLTNFWFGDYKCD